MKAADSVPREVLTEEFYAQNPTVESWTKGEKFPTVKQLESFTHKVHVPFGYMFLPNPPEELGESAGFDNRHLLPADDPMEVFCDKLAAEFLVPGEYFLQKWEITQDYKSLSRMFKVSPIVIARRALDLKLINLNRFLTFYNDYLSDFRHRKARQGPGGMKGDTYNKFITEHLY